MPCYQFTVLLTSRTKHIGIRQLPNSDIDQVWREYERQAQTHYGAKLKKFTVVMLSKLSPEVRSWIERQGTKQDPLGAWDGKIQAKRGGNKYEGPAHVNILFAIHNLRRPKYSTILQFLRHNRRSIASTLIVKYLIDLEVSGHILKSENKVYSLSSRGHCILITLEKVARGLRSDR
jgi:hypothetical protein